MSKRRIAASSSASGGGGRHLQLAALICLTSVGCSDGPTAMGSGISQATTALTAAETLCQTYLEGSGTRYCGISASESCEENGARLVAALGVFRGARRAKRTFVLLSAGTYCLTDTLRPTSHMSIVGMGDRRSAPGQRSTLRMLAPGIPTVKLERVSGVALKRVNLEQESSEQGMGGGVEILNSHEVTISASSLWQGTFGIMVHSPGQPCSKIRISNTLIEYTNSMGLALRQMVASEIRNNHIRHAGSDAIKISGGPFNDNLILGNYLSGSLRDGLDAAFMTNWCTACQNDGHCPRGLEACEDDSQLCQSSCAPLKCSQGPSRGGYSGNLFANNLVFDNQLLGIAWKLTDGECKDDPHFALGDNTVKNNIVVRNGASGFEIRGSWVEAGTQPQWQMLPLSKYTLVEGNLSCGNGGAAITIAHTYNVHLHHNWLQGNGNALPQVATIPPLYPPPTCNDGASLCPDGACPLQVTSKGQTASYCPGEAVCPLERGGCVFRRPDGGEAHQLGVALFENRQLMMSGNVFRSGDCSVRNANFQCPNDAASAATVELIEPLSVAEPSVLNQQVRLQAILAAYPYHLEDDDGDGVANAIEALYFASDPLDASDSPSAGVAASAIIDICQPVP